MAAEAYVKEYLADEKAALAKYNLKRIVLEGEVVDKVGDGSGATFLELAGVRGEAETVNVVLGIVLLERDNVTKFLNLKVGDRVTVSGMVDALGGITRTRGKSRRVLVSMGRIEP